jgi:hypothetical protein
MVKAICAFASIVRRSFDGHRRRHMVVHEIKVVSVAAAQRWRGTVDPALLNLCTRKASRREHRVDQHGGTAGREEHQPEKNI